MKAFIKRNEQNDRTDTLACRHRQIRTDSPSECDSAGLVPGPVVAPDQINPPVVKLFKGLATISYRGSARASLAAINRVKDGNVPRLADATHLFSLLSGARSRSFVWKWNKWNVGVLSQRSSHDAVCRRGVGTPPQT